MLVIRRSTRDGRVRDDERGAVAIIVAVSLTALLVVLAMVLDFGQVRLDRQENKSAADAAATAGMQEMGGGKEPVYTYRGVCKAVQYLGTNMGLALDGWAGCSEGAPTWNTVCVPGDPSTYARFETTVAATEGRPAYDIVIDSPHVIDTAYPEESLASLAGDQGDAEQQGCDQLGVVITETREPGLGKLFMEDGEQFVTTVRTVGRVTPSEDDAPVALLMLEREDCGVLEISGTNARIRVLGTPPGLNPDGTEIPSTPAIIHSDSLGNGDDCGTGSNIFNGNKPRGIVADQSLPPGDQVPGLITTRALSGAPGSVPAKASDPYDDVVAEPGPPNEVSGRELVSRAVVDQAYLSGVRGAVGYANLYVFGSVTSATPGWKVIADCRPTQAEVNALNITATDKVYVDCTGAAGFRPTNVTIPAGTVFFNGFIASSATDLRLPNATRVYIYGQTGANAPGLNASGTFRMHTQGRTTCGTGTWGSTAQLFIKHGQLQATGGLLQLCNTTVFMMGGYGDACVPSVEGAPPTSLPCGGGTSTGNGQVSIAGGAAMDWTAPNTTRVKVEDRSNLEDLALWGESYGDGGTWSMAGSGSMTLRGIFMVPNASPFNLKGGGGQDVRDSQYIATKLNVTGNGDLLMQPAADLLTLPNPPHRFLVR